MINDKLNKEILDSINENKTEIIGLQGKIIWTNQYPTNSFSNQNITLSEALNNFDSYEILFAQAKLNADPTNSGNRLMSTGKIPIGYGTVLNYAVNNRYRLIDRPSGNTQMLIQDAYNGGQVDNEKCVPIFVIGYNTGLFS